MFTNIMKRDLYHPYSPDLALCDFYFFDYVNESLTGRKFADRKKLLAVIICILEDIERVTLERVFLAWMDHLT
jgi:hypothetical protein